MHKHQASPAQDRATSNTAPLTQVQPPSPPPKSLTNFAPKYTRASSWKGILKEEICRIGNSNNLFLFKFPDRSESEAAYALCVIILEMRLVESYQRKVLPRYQCHTAMEVRMYV